MSQRPENFPGEDWREVPSFPGYFASSAGRIRGRRGRIRKLFKDAGGYFRVNVSIDGKAYSRTVHSMVCEAFHGRRPTPEHEAAHGNGVRDDNRSDNLRWATYDENREDMKLHGTWPVGEKHPRAGLTAEQVAAIREHCASVGAGRLRIPRGTRQKLAKQYGVSLHVIKDILGGRSWTGSGQ